jgi:hypothetical protein
LLAPATETVGSQELLSLEDLVDQIEPFHQGLVRTMPLDEAPTGTDAIDNMHS